MKQGEKRTLQVSKYTSDQPQIGGMEVFKIATLNINGLTSRREVEVLEDFRRRQEIDILYLQEVANSTIETQRRYKTYTNVGTTWRGTAMMMTNEITITNITRLPSGRGIAVEYRAIWLVNVYTPSGHPSDRRENVSIKMKSSTC